MIEDILNWLLAMVVIVAVLAIMYSAVRKQGIADTWDELKYMVEGSKDKAEDTFNNYK